MSPFCAIERNEVVEEVRALSTAPNRKQERLASPRQIAVLPETNVEKLAAPHREKLTARLTALSVEFVAMPGAAQRLSESLPREVNATLQLVDGYAGCMVLVADQEARLVTVITLWNGPERAQRCGENAPWVKRLLTPYVDRWLRTQKLVTAITGLPQASPNACH